MSATTIKCPNCGTHIDIDEIFYHQIEEKFKQQHLKQQKKRAAIYKSAFEHRNK